MQKQLGIASLVALVISTMIGAGIFSLPQNIAAGASAGAVSIAWLITGVGMSALVLVFHFLAKVKPELQGGIFDYAKAGFGDFMGFNSAWGYWICNLLANVSYAVVFFGALSIFTDTTDWVLFGEGNTVAAIIGASILVWTMHFLVLRGVQVAAAVNIVATIAKLLPIIVFIVAVILAFQYEKFSFDFWGTATPELGSVMDQVKASMMVTLWVFIGIEGAVIVSGRAKNRSDVGKATIIALICALTLYIMVTLFTFGVMTQPEIAALHNPSMGQILAHILGPCGAKFVSAGLVISVSGALLSWTVVSAEAPFVAAKSGLFPRCFRRENKNGSASFSLWASTLLVQFFLIMTLVQESTYLALVYIATSAVLLPYLLAAAYAVKLVISQQKREHKMSSLIIAIIATLYSCWLVYAAGLDALLLCALLYAPGIWVYRKAKKEADESFLTSHKEKTFAALLIFMAITACYMIATGTINL
ncbi:basic amino acid/polyamine antiporter [Motilimonas sp. 1_MG-2023]|uniref:basic amino acid/polyamine antiporter n=1 Tax=Motilimonas sp. 1_MG-2023 TaxID=3062672 RepID=UPI0026E36399|nr:basic amino acid/polyamine antiporter [Motilimonas sp. 1_MG-2023]MDO6526607.1 basic amino acid/polyamine antiporter [Motilimonas sp. 1_MG-2023]